MSSTRRRSSKRSPPAPRVGSRSPATRASIVEAALGEFGARGYAGASLHAIAARAGVHAPQISYHYGDKRGLWEAAVSSLVTELDRRIDRATDPTDAEATLRALIPLFVQFAADHPEMNRIVVWESAADSDRLRWLIDTVSRRRFDELVVLLEPLQRAGIVKPIPPTSFYYLFIGGASLPFVAAPEARVLAGEDPAGPAFVAAHAEALTSLLFVDP